MLLVTSHWSELGRKAATATREALQSRWLSWAHFFSSEASALFKS